MTATMLTAGACDRRAPRRAAHGAAARSARRAWTLPAVALIWLLVGAGVWLLRSHAMGEHVWMAGLVVLGLPIVWRTVREAVRGQFAADLVATLAVVVAILLVQPLAGLVIVLMQTGGEALEEYAEGRASAAVRALEDDAPRTAHRLGSDGDRVAEDLPVDAVRVGDYLLVRPGEMVPCDGVVVNGTSHIDTARLTGEAIPIPARPAMKLSSGALNLESALTMRATAIAGESQYARIVDLVRNAQQSKAPLQRVADRYAIWFTPITLVVCVVAFAVSRDWERVLAVLVVATPCPLILATPVAIIGGINKAARIHVVVRTGGALEQLASARTAIFDKTGTLTVGMPAVSRVVSLGTLTESELLRLAAAVEHHSGHLLARSVVEAATEAGVAIPPVVDVREEPGQGVRGHVEGRGVVVGAKSFADSMAGSVTHAHDAAPTSPGLRAWVVVDERLEGFIEFADRVRDGIPALLEELRTLGIDRTLLLSGDSREHTAAIASAVGISDARGQLLPSDKVDVVNSLIRTGERVMMIGDGTNDAPALSAAHVGVALGGHGGGITAEAADVVLLTDDITCLAELVRMSRRTLRVARQSIWVGLGLSALGMGAAALGFIPPVAGAGMQEALDIAVIMNALRTSR